MDINKVIIVGRIGKIGELKILPTGTKVCELSLATKKFVKDKEKTIWHNIVCYGRTAELVTDYTQVGQTLGVEGFLDSSSWEDKNGAKRTKVFVVAEKVHFGARPAGSNFNENEDEEISVDDISKDVPAKSKTDTLDIPEEELEMMNNIPF